MPPVVMLPMLITGSIEFRRVKSSATIQRQTRARDGAVQQAEWRKND